jgi:hypothetical protein
MGFFFGFWFGLFAGIGGYWLYNNPKKRAALVAKLRGLFKK